MRVRVLSLLMVMAMLAVACGAPKSSGFSPIERDVPAALTATTTTTTTTIASTTTTIALASTTTVVEPPPTTAVSQYVTLFFIAGRQQLFGIDVLLPRGVPVAQVMEVLQRGPTGATASTLRSAIPQEASISTLDTRGVVSVDLPLDFFDAAEENDERLAIAQIVLTLTLLNGISQVVFTQEGREIAVLLGDGSESEEGQPLYREDYIDMISGNAPTTTTTTTTTTIPATTTSVAVIDSTTPSDATAATAVPNAAPAST